MIKNQGVKLKVRFLELPKQGKNSWKRYLLVLVLVIAFGETLAFYFLPSICLFTGCEESKIYGSRIPYFSLDLVTYGIPLIILLGCIKYIHKRPITSVLTSRSQFDWRRYLFAIQIFGIIYIFSEGGAKSHFSPAL